MAVLTLIQIATIVSVSVVTGIVVLSICAWFWRVKTPELRVNSTPVAFLFERDDLVQATPIAQTLLDDTDSDMTWASVRAALNLRFPAMPTSPPSAEDGQIEVEASDPEDGATLRIETLGRRTRIELMESETDILRNNRYDVQAMRILRDQLEEVCQTSPYPMWRVDGAGQITWSNHCYQSLAKECGQAIEDATQPVLKIPHVGIDQRRSRASTTNADTGRAAWFDICATPVRNGAIYHAANIDAVIQAEIAQRNFVQTLAKTFAQLATGLAIFDRNGQLVLFNPALIDLTGLPAEFLSARPELITFFDRLRDKRSMPEPKNYGNWRQSIQDMVKEASEDGYQETWTLENGYTYRITGRPHPDGAVAFLFEDISAEVSLTRNFRAELELGQSVLDAYDEAIAVFSSSGILTFCNKAYCEMWSLDPDSSFADTTIIDSTRAWQSMTKPTPAWGEVRDFIMKLGERAPWETTVTRNDGAVLMLRVAPIASGAASLRFEVQKSIVEIPAAQNLSAEQH